MMPGLLFKWLFMPMLLLSLPAHKAAHPIFVSVTEIEHNAKDKTLEISCKIFTDDFEKTLRAAYKTHVDLLDPAVKPAMEKMINDYVQKHLKIKVNGQQLTIKYAGFEQIEEGIYSYYQADNVSTLKKIEIMDDLLFEYKSEQMNLIHVIEKGERKSTKLSNPDRVAVLEF